MTPANELLHYASHNFDKFIRNARPYEGKKPAFNAVTHKQQVAKNLAEEYNEMQKETEYSRKWWFEFADTLFCAYTALKIRLKEYEDAKIERFVEYASIKYIPYIYAVATAVSNGSKFFDIDKLVAKRTQENIEPHEILYQAIQHAHANQWELWQTYNDGKVLYFFSKDGKVQKSTQFGYRSKDFLHTYISRLLSNHYTNVIKNDMTELSGCIDEVQMIKLIVEKYEKMGDLNHFIINL
jgi:hypothetical protein